MENGLRVALVEGERYTPLYARLTEFTEQTGISLDVEQFPLSELQGLLRAGSLPYDVVSAHSQYTAGLASALLPLDDLLSETEILEFEGQALDLCRWKGHLYQLPRSVETRLLFYRSDIFEDRREKRWFAEASGGNELRVPRTWDELAAVAQYFTREGRMHGWVFPGYGSGLVSTFAEILTTVGGTFFDADGRPRFYSRAGEWSLTLLRDLYGRWGAVPPETPELGEEEVSEMFRMGRCALACDYPGTARLLCDPTFSAVAGWHSVALLPAGPEGRRAVWTGCPTFAVTAGCRNPEGAVELLRFLTSDESQLLEAKYGAIPCRGSARQACEERLREGTLGHLRFRLAMETLRSSALTAPALPQYAEIEQQLWPYLQQAILGEREVVEALELGVRAVEELLAG